MVRIAKDLDESIEGEDVLLVEDIVDTGFTLRYLLQTLASRGPNSLAVCTFLDRNSRRIVQVPVDFRCFEIPDRFVVGFGLDYHQLHRNLGYVAVMKPRKGTLTTFLQYFWAIVVELKLGKSLMWKVLGSVSPP